MNRDELDKRNTAAITHWWVTMRDTGKVAPGLLDDLARIADEHAAGQQQATLDHHDDLAAAVQSSQFTTDDGMPPIKAASPGPPPRPSARTRTRTRGGSHEA